MNQKLITKKPEKIRTHTRYDMRQPYYKTYVKCVCNKPLVLTSLDWTECPTCSRKYKTGNFGGLSAPYGQDFGWPVKLKKFIRPAVSLDAHMTLQNSTFNIGRVTKKLIKEIHELGGRVRFSYNECTDGRSRVSQINYESFYTDKAQLEGVLYFDIYPELRNNKIINETLRYFIADLKALVESEKNRTKFKPVGFSSKSTVSVSTKDVYSY